MTEYQTTRQKDSEYLDDWANRSVGLAYRAFHDLPEARVEQLAITRLCQGCSDKDAGQVTITGHTRPTSVSAAVSAIRWYQLNHQVIFGSRSRGKGCGYGGDFLRRANNEPEGGFVCHGRYKPGGW